MCVNIVLIRYRSFTQKWVKPRLSSYYSKKSNSSKQFNILRTRVLYISTTVLVSEGVPLHTRVIYPMIWIAFTPSVFTSTLHARVICEFLPKKKKTSASYYTRTLSCPCSTPLARILRGLLDHYQLLSVFGIYNLIWYSETATQIWVASLFTMNAFQIWKASLFLPWAVSFFWD